MKAYKLKFGTYDGEGEWDAIYFTHEEVIESYREERKKYKENSSFEEFEPDQSFGVDGIMCEWYEINIPEVNRHKVQVKPLVYLASPYTDHEEEYFQKVSAKASELMNQGIMIFCPIAMSHPMSIYGKLPGEWEFWEKFDRIYISLCHKLIVYRLPGWEMSKGVQAEMKIAKEFNIPIEYID